MRSNAATVAAATAAAQEAAASAAAASAAAAAKAMAAAGSEASGSVVSAPGTSVIENTSRPNDNGPTSAADIQSSAAATAAAVAAAVAAAAATASTSAAAGSGTGSTLDLPQKMLQHHQFTPVSLPGFVGSSSSATSMRGRPGFQGIHAAIAASGAVGLGPGEARNGAQSAPAGPASSMEEEEPMDGRRRRGRKRPLPTSQCEGDQCFKGPSYGPSGTPAKRCALHKIPGDVYVKNQCVHIGCTKVR